MSPAEHGSAGDGAPAKERAPEAAPPARPTATHDAPQPAATHDAPRPFRVPHLVVLGIATALPAAVGGALTLAGEGALAAALAKTLTGIALVGLVVALNSLLRQEGLGGEGLSGAAGALGAALVTLGGSAAALDVAKLPGAILPNDPGQALLQPLGRVGWLLVALWLGRSGWALRRLVAPSGAVGWGSLAACATLAGLAFSELARAHAGEALPTGSAALVPVAFWATGVAVAAAFGRMAAPEAQPE
jgi:hypothetical protein